MAASVAGNATHLRADLLAGLGSHRVALIADTHYWPPSEARRSFVAKMAAASERDGLLVDRTPEVLSQLFRELRIFAAGGGAAAVHLGDAGCGGASFSQPAAEHAASLRAYRDLENASLPAAWPITHIPGNHDFSPSGGLVAWRAALGGLSPIAPVFVSGAPLPPTNYRSLRFGRWRLLLLDSNDGLSLDVGHGHVGAAQLSWLEGELASAAEQRQLVALATHQLLVDPTAPTDDDARRRRIALKSAGGGSGWLGPSTAGPSWIGEGDLIDNREEVLALLARYSRVVRLSVHGHVHANTITRWRGIAFVSLASTSEYPIQWHELTLAPCAASLVAHDLDVEPSLREEAVARDSRPGRNRLKRGAGRAMETVEDTSTVTLELEGLCSQEISPLSLAYS